MSDKMQKDSGQSDHSILRKSPKMNKISTQHITHMRISKTKYMNEINLNDLSS